MKKLFLTLALAVGMVLELSVALRPSPDAPRGEASNFAEAPHGDPPLSFASIKPIDAHTHVQRTNVDFGRMLNELNLHILDICVANDHDPHYKSLDAKIADLLSSVHQSNGRAFFCTTFNPYLINTPAFGAQAVKQLDQNFYEGAVAVKIWKNVGMEIKNKEGQFVMPDDPALTPIYRDIAAHGKTLIAHLAEPTSCWLPPDPASPDYDYYNEHPEWYMYRQKGYPSKQTILAARDHMLAENPKLRVVGAHLGSMELDVDEIARRFDRYPNFAVDTAARVPYLMLQPRSKVRKFLIKYQDRVLYGTDLEFMPGDSVKEALNEWRDTYARDWKFFATSETIQYQGREIRGLELPIPVLRKIFHANAIQWIPGMASANP